MKVNRLLLVVLLLLFLFLSGPFINAGPVGDFFKKVGQSVSKPFQPQPPPQSTRPQPTKTPHATRRPTSRAATAATATPPAVAQPSQLPKEEAAAIEKTKADLPYGIPVPGRK